MYPQNEMAALVLAHAFEDELVHIKEAGVLRDAAVFAKQRVGRVVRGARNVYDKGSPLGVRKSLGLRTPAAAEQTGRIMALNRAAKAQRAAFLAGTRAGPIKMPQPTALQMRQKVQGRVGNVATPASRPSQGVVGSIREANKASLARMRARRDASMQQAGGFGRLMRVR